MGAIVAMEVVIEVVVREAVEVVQTDLLFFCDAIV